MIELRGRRLLAHALVAGMLAVSVAGCAQKNTNAAGAGVATPGSPQDFAANVGDRVFFTVDSSSLTGQATATLGAQAAWLNKYPKYQITVEGHADERGTREYNIALSNRRGEATRSYLASRGVAASRMRMIGYGKERPVAVCDAEQCWNQNRRAVTVLGN